MEAVFLICVVIATAIVAVRVLHKENQEISNLSAIAATSRVNDVQVSQDSLRAELLDHARQLTAKTDSDNKNLDRLLDNAIASLRSADLRSADQPTIIGDAALSAHRAYLEKLNRGPTTKSVRIKRGGKIYYLDALSYNILSDWWKLDSDADIKASQDIMEGVVEVRGAGQSAVGPNRHNTPPNDPAPEASLTDTPPDPENREDVRKP